MGRGRGVDGGGEGGVRHRPPAVGSGEGNDVGGSGAV